MSSIVIHFLSRRVPGFGFITIFFLFFFFFCIVLKEQDKTRSYECKVKFVLTPYIRLVKFQLVRQIPDVYVSACVLAAKLFLLFFSCFSIL